MANLELENDFAQQFVQEYEIMNLKDEDPYDLAYFIDENWFEITGLSEKEKDNGDPFDEEIEDICSELEVSMDDFLDAWASVREVSDDFIIEDDEDEDDEEEIEDDDYFDEDDD